VKEDAAIFTKPPAGAAGAAEVAEATGAASPSAASGVAEETAGGEDAVVEAAAGEAVGEAAGMAGESNEAGTEADCGDGTNTKSACTAFTHTAPHPRDPVSEGARSGADVCGASGTRAHGA